MAKFRKKPIVIEAVQWQPGTGIEGMQQTTLHKDFREPAMTYEGPALMVPTLEGNMFALPGDWIITGVNGEKYPCKPDIFAKTYEAVEETGV